MLQSSREIPVSNFLCLSCRTHTRAHTHAHTHMLHAMWMLTLLSARLAEKINSWERLFFLTCQLGACAGLRVRLCRDQLGCWTSWRPSESCLRVWARFGVSDPPYVWRVVRGQLQDPDVGVKISADLVCFSLEKVTPASQNVVFFRLVSLRFSRLLMDSRT